MEKLYQWLFFILKKRKTIQKQIKLLPHFILFEMSLNREHNLSKRMQI